MLSFLLFYKCMLSWFETEFNRVLFGLLFTSSIEYYKFMFPEFMNEPPNYCQKAQTSEKSCNTIK